MVCFLFLSLGLRVRGVWKGYYVPGPHAVAAVETVDDAGGNQAGKGAADEGAGVEHGGPETELFSSVPR